MKGEIKMEKIVYADNSATTKIHPDVISEMLPYLQENFGNPSSMYKLGRTSKKAIANARTQLAELLSCSANEIYFTSCGSESINWALKGAAKIIKAKGKKHIITSMFEHHAVLHTMDSLKDQGFEITYLKPDENGIISPENLENAITQNTGLVSIMYVNNEIGSIQPIKELCKIAKRSDILFHTDAVQATAQIPIDVKDLNVDFLSLSGHKFGAPKGIGALYCKKGIKLKSYIDGGAQENGKRAGTENTAFIVGLGKAAEIANNIMQEKHDKVKKLRDKLLSSLLEIPDSRLNGNLENRIYGNINIGFKGIEGEALVLMLDVKYGICVSTGSACTSGFTTASHVLTSIDVPEEYAKSSIRITLGMDNTEEEIEYIANALKETISLLRSLSI